MTNLNLFWARETVLMRNPVYWMLTLSVFFFGATLLVGYAGATGMGAILVGVALYGLNNMPGVYITADFSDDDMIADARWFSGLMVGFFVSWLLLLLFGTLAVFKHLMFGFVLLAIARVIVLEDVGVPTVFRWIGEHFFTDGGVLERALVASSSWAGKAFGTTMGLILAGWALLSAKVGWATPEAMNEASTDGAPAEAEPTPASTADTLAEPVANAPAPEEPVNPPQADVPAQNPPSAEAPSPTSSTLNETL